MKSRIASTAFGVTLLMAGASCNSSTISGKGIGGIEPGWPCTASAQCASGDCGAGSCCAAACSTSDAVCGAVGCNDAGACVYPSAETACPGTSCSDGTLSQMACDGAGTCRPAGIGTTCPGNYACANDGSCGNSCSSTAYCASGFVCNAGRCVKPIGAGSCTENDDCQSEICGAAGTGNCCRASCATGDADCGPTDCDDGGACLYQTSAVVCGPAQQSCAGSTQANPSHCDGLGHCEGGTTSCAPFICGINACKTSCAYNADCVAGAACDVSTTTCCAGLADGDVLAVDSVLGDDATPCCGSLGALPCRTLTRAMGLIEGGTATRATLLAKVNGAASGDWIPAGEIYPIALGWGVELKAPGIFFPGASDAGRFSAIFELRADAGGAESASIVGTATSPVGIGMNHAGGQLAANSAIWVGPGSTIYLANASVNGSWSDSSFAIHAGGTLVLGQDRSGVVTGPIRIGNDLANSNTDGLTGIACYGCTLSDVPTNAISTLVITGQRHIDIDVEGPATVLLSSAPIVGVAPSSVGFSTCPSKADTTGIYMKGPVTMGLDHATIQCTGGDGIALDGYDDGGIPSLTLNDTTIQNTELALVVFAGSAVVSNSTVRYNSAGVLQGPSDFGLPATIDLSGGPVGGRNTVACSNEIESDYAYGGYSVQNDTSATLNASNVDWDTAGPDLFSCGPDLSNCSCQIATCTDLPDASGLDAVVMDGGGTITTTGNGLSPLSCAVPPPSN